MRVPYFAAMCCSDVFSLDFFRIPAPTPLNYVHSVGAGLRKIW